MAIHIQSGKNNSDEKTINAKIQYVPFHIKADCDANIKNYFETYVKTAEDGSLTASFRGYPLDGVEMELPDGYTGIVLHERIKPVTDKDERKFYVTHTFNKMIYWNWDKKVSKNDTFMKALDWIDIAEALHSPIDVE